MKRRTFLQQAGLVLLALGVSETALSLTGEGSVAVPLLDRYYQALAQPSARKLALLVGINQYPYGTPLSGCVTDVELQRELLIHRFGFHPGDILTLTDSQATRENIETAFLEHLTKQAAAGDVVVFHFSGYGSRVPLSQKSRGQNLQSKTDDPLETQDFAFLQNSLVPVDGRPTTQESVPVNNLLEETLLLLLRSLATDQITTILDTSYTNTGSVLQGNLRIRSCPSPNQGQPSIEELAFQEQLLLKLNASRDLLKQQIRKDQRDSYGYLPGIVLAAAGPSQPATEAPLGGFSAGLFTYALTQLLWQATPPTTVQVSISRAAGAVEQMVGSQQQPTVSGQKSREESLLAYHLMPTFYTCADGVVTGVEDNGKTVNLWLAGLPVTVLAYYGVNSLMTLVRPGEVTKSPTDPNGGLTSTVSPTTQRLHLQIRSKDGLTAKARLIETDIPEDSNLLGQLIQESIRILPRNVGLTIAIDAHLERIERVDATSAFSNIAAVSSVAAAGEQPADYLFGRVVMAGADRTKEFAAEGADTINSSQIATTALVAKSSVTSLRSYGLFSLGLNPIPNTTGQPGEAVKVAVNRLTPKLKALLAAKLWGLTTNEGSSRLGIQATLEIVSPSKQVLMQRETWRSRSVTGKLLQEAWQAETSGNLFKFAHSSAVDSVAGIPTIPIGSHIQYRIQNQSPQPVYLVVLGNDSSGNAIAVYPPQSFQAANASDIKSTLQDVVIPVGATLTVPNPAASFDWVVQGPVGIAQIQLICSRTPFRHTLMALAAARRSEHEQEQVGDLLNAVDVAQAVLQDLHDASTMPATGASSVASDTYALDVNAWATLSFIYQVA